MKRTRWKIRSSGCSLGLKGKRCDVVYVRGAKTFTVRMSWERFSAGKYPARPSSPAQLRRLTGLRVTKVRPLRRRRGS